MLTAYALFEKYLQLTDEIQNDLCYNEKKREKGVCFVEKSLINDAIRKRYIKRLFVLLFGIALFYAVVCTPVSIIVSSDILLSETAWPLVVDLVLWVFNYLYFWIAFAFLLYFAVCFGKSAYSAVVGMYLGATVFRYTANLVSGFYQIGFPRSSVFVSKYLPYFIIDIFMDAVQFSIAFLVVHFCTEKIVVLSRNLPITKLIDRRNVVAKAAFWLAAIPALIQLGSRVIYDIDFGAPRGLSDLLWMIFSYWSDCMGLVIGYFVILLIVKHLYVKAEETKLSYEAEEGLSPNQAEEEEEE